MFDNSYNGKNICRRIITKEVIKMTTQPLDGVGQVMKAEPAIKTGGETFGTFKLGNNLMANELAEKAISRPESPMKTGSKIDIAA